MNIRNYYFEIKNRFVLLVLAWSAVISVSYIYREILLFVITKQSAVYNKEIFYFIFTDVTEVFYVYVMLIFFFGTQIWVLYFFYHMLIFVALGLYQYEYNYLVRIFNTCIFMHIFSIIIFNKILFPFSWDFFLSFQNVESLELIPLHFEAKLSEYLRFYIAFYYVNVLYFQIFVILILVFDYLKNELLIIKQFRKLLYYSFVILSTLFTPPDVYSQILLSISLIFGYEILVYYSILKKLLKK